MSQPCEATLVEHIFAIATHLAEGGVSPHGCALNYPALVEIAEAYRLVTNAAPYTAVIAPVEYAQYREAKDAALLDTFEPTVVH